jgi:hydrogenase expression/formation protein HypC
MCVGIPMQVTSTRELAADCAPDPRVGGAAERVDLALVGPQPVGQWLLVHLGAAREALSAADADAIARALQGLRAAMAGGDPGDAFADLEAREPALPPHLEAARRAGATQA